MSGVDPIGHQHRQLDILITMVMLGNHFGDIPYVGAAAGTSHIGLLERVFQFKESHLTRH